MNGLHEDLQPVATQLQRLADALYGSADNPNEVDRDEIAAALPDVDAGELDELIQNLDEKEIIAYDNNKGRIRLKPLGKRCYSLNCVPELALGFPYCADKYGAAVVRITVTKPDGSPAAGTGFFIADVPNRIVTNRHVVFSNQIQRIEHQNGTLVHEGALQFTAGPVDLDLAAIECPMPPGVTALRLDWEKDSVRPMDEVLVLGYPYVAGHHPALLHAQGRIGMRAKRMSGPEEPIRESLMLSDIAAPGCSGGPVISARGMAIGVIEQQSVTHLAEAPPISFLGALPSYYLGELLPP